MSFYALLDLNVVSTVLRCYGHSTAQKMNRLIVANIYRGDNGPQIMVKSRFPTDHLVLLPKMGGNVTAPFVYIRCTSTL